jgi:hypothetical protein
LFVEARQTTLDSRDTFDCLIVSILAARHAGLGTPRSFGDHGAGGSLALLQIGDQLDE